MSPAVTEAVYALWDELSEFPASRHEDALKHLMEWFRQHLDVDNVLWLGSLLMQDEEVAREDPFCGWRLRSRRSLMPDSEKYKKLVAEFFATEHYGRLTPSFYTGGLTPEQEVHVGATSRGMVAGAGKFRVHRMRDGWIDFQAFRRSEHYRLYYTDMGITDRIWVAFPLGPKTESLFLLDRQERPGSRRRYFTDQDKELAGMVLRGIREFHRRLLLLNGVLLGEKSLSPLKLRILQGLLTGLSEKEIANSTGQNPLTMRKYVTELYTEYGVKTRPALMALWLGEPNG